MAIAALEAGKHVWCEKPMATSLADAERMAAAARASGKVAVMGYNYIQNPLIRHMAELRKVRTEPYNMRSRLGECVNMRTTNATHLDNDPTVSGTASWSAGSRCRSATNSGRAVGPGVERVETKRVAPLQLAPARPSVALIVRPRLRWY